MQLDLWASKEGYTIGLESESLFDLDADDWQRLITDTIDLFNSARDDDDELVMLTIGQENVAVSVDVLPHIIAALIDLQDVEFPDDFEKHDSIYRCLMLDLTEDVV